jgi:hypothetical protein
MRNMLRHGLIAASLAIVGCDSDGVARHTYAPNVTLTAPTAGQTFGEGLSAPVFSAVVVDDNDALADPTLTWSIEGLGPLTGDVSLGDGTVTLSVTTALPLGEHVLSLEAIDSGGEVGSDTVSFSVVVNALPTAEFETPTEAQRYGEGRVVTVRLLVSDSDENDLRDLSIRWGGDLSESSETPEHPDSHGVAEAHLMDMAIGNHAVSAVVTDSLGADVNVSTWFEVVVTDSDGDGYDDTAFGGSDCDDQSASDHPGAQEDCDGVDNDCDGAIDEDAEDSTRFYEDDDGDGYGDPDQFVSACEAPEGFVDNDDDCNDNNADIHPDGTEVCDGADNDCDGDTDGANALDAVVWYVDDDGDGYGDLSETAMSCSVPDGHVASSADCDDSDPAVNPEADERCDGIDNDCDGQTDDSISVDADTWYADTDGDDHGDPDSSQTACEQPADHVLVDTDCDDDDGAVNPDAAETCNGIDDNCDGETDESTALDGQVFYADSDGDSYGDPETTTTACSEPSGYTSDDSDCNDADASINPAGTELCDGADNDCNGEIDEDEAADVVTWYLDADGDGFGGTSTTALQCDGPSGYALEGSDCDDDDATTNPGATEFCDGIDNNCDGETDEATAADAEDWYPDLDGDGYGDDSVVVDSASCDGGSGLVTDHTDCDDSDDSAWPGADELCDGDDDDCDGVADESAVDGNWWPEDLDEDGYGSQVATVWACEGPSNRADCDDGDLAEPTVVDVTGTSSSADGSADHPFVTIQEGLEQAVGCVAVHPGTYLEAVDFGGLNVAVVSTEGPEATVIDATGLGDSVVTFSNGETAAASLDGFTITGGEGNLDESYLTWDCSSSNTTGDICSDYFLTYCGGGIYVSAASPTLSNLIVQANTLAPAGTTYQTNHMDNNRSGGETFYTYSYGGGLCLLGSDSVLTQVHALENFADQGGGAFLDETSFISWDASWVAGNEGTDGAGVMVDGGTLAARNVVIVGNIGTGVGGGLFIQDGVVDLENVTFGFNENGTGDGLYLYGSSVGDMDSSIVYGGSGTGVLVDGSSTWHQVYSVVAGYELLYSGVTDPTGINGNLDQDPLFTDITDDSDWTDDDWTLSAESPAIDGGNPDEAMNDADDTPNNMGAFGGADSEWNL